MSNIKYEVVRSDYDNTITGRNAIIEINGKTEKAVQQDIDSLEIYLTNNNYSLGDYEIVTENGKYFAQIFIAIDDREEFEEVKEIYKEWKSAPKEMVVEETVNTEIEEVKENNLTPENTEITNSIEVTETTIEIQDINENLLNESVKIELGNRTYTGKVYDINMNTGIIWIEINEDIFELNISDIQNLYGVTATNKWLRNKKNNKLNSC